MALTTQAGNACHRYRVWNYPWPQRCAIRAVHARPVQPVEDRSWYVEIIPPPDEREFGLEQLREKMRQ